VVGDWVSKTFADVTGNWIFYYPFRDHAGGGGATDIKGIDKLEELFRAFRGNISKQFTSDWEPRLGFHGNLLIHNNSQRGHGRDWTSALGQWVSFWRNVILASIQHKYELDTGSTNEYGETRVINPELPDFTTLLDHGYWMLSPEVPSDYVQATWTDTLTMGTRAGHVQAKTLYEWYFNTFLTKHLAQDHEHLYHTQVFQKTHFQRMQKYSPPRYVTPQQEPGDDSVVLPPGMFPPGTDPRTRFPARDEPDAPAEYQAAPLRALPRGSAKRTQGGLQAKISQLERRLAQSEQSGNMRYLLERVLTRLDEGQVE